MRKGAAQRHPGAPDLEFEASLWEKGLRLIAGVDEVGRGALAGPVAAGVLILPPDQNVQKYLAGMHDSKQHTPAEREDFVRRLQNLAVAYGTGFATAAEIDQMGIVPATRLAMCNALSQLDVAADHLLIDYISLPECSTPQTSIVKGDERSLSIAGASIIAKVCRDEIMRQLDDRFPGYGFATHKGYGTLKHRQAIQRLGPSPVHRLSFKITKSTLS